MFILTVLMTNVHRSVSTRTTEIAIRCLFFARYEEVMGSREVDIVLPGGSKVSDAVEAVRTGVSGGAGLPARPLVARNQRHAALDTDLSDGDELAFLPPLAGG